MKEFSEMLILKNDTAIFKDEDGHWHIKAGPNVFNLASQKDFWRAIAVLELPLCQVELRLGEKFPYHLAVISGLKNGSDYWVELALSWIAKMPIHASLHFSQEMRAICSNKKYSQKIRSVAKRELARLNRGVAMESSNTN